MHLPCLAPPIKDRKLTTIARERSSDGKLTLVVERYDEPDGSVGVLLGFEEGSWHIHPPPNLDSGAAAEQWALGIVADVVGDRMLVVTSRDASFEEVRLAKSAEFEVDFKLISETLEFRFWTGQRVSIEDLIDGKVSYKALP